LRRNIGRAKSRNLPAARHRATTSTARGEIIGFEGSIPLTLHQRRPTSTAISPGGKFMPFYLTRFSYTPATWAKLIKNPEDRRAAAKQYIEAVGGKMHGFWYAFGDHDAYNLWEAPDNVSMAATAIAISSGGALSSLHTTVLLSVEDTLAALQKASSIKYRPPGDKG
jgi:uncharacterized protein with GYD domain